MPVGRAIEILRKEGFASLISSSLKFIAKNIEGSDGQGGQPRRELTTLIDKDSPIIVDGGANRGQTIQLMESLFSNPQIYAFEPIPELANGLKETYSSNRINIVNKGLGSSDKEVKLNVAEKSVQSSILNPSQNVNKRHGGNVARREEVNITTLDSELDSLRNIDILKLDLQGYELEALKGGRNCLNDTELILTEVQFTRLYDEADLFCDVVEYLEENGFELYNLYSLSRGPNGRLEWGDAIFLSSDKMEKITNKAGQHLEK